MTTNISIKIRKQIFLTPPWKDISSEPMIEYKSTVTCHSPVPLPSSASKCLSPAHNSHLYSLARQGN